MRPPVLIVGAHRSGTSATAHALEILGLQIGQKLDSHFEPRSLQQVHEKYLRQVGASWYEPTPFLDSLHTAEGERQSVAYLRENIERKFAQILGYQNPRGLWILARLKIGAPWGWKEPRTTLFLPSWLKIFPQARMIHVARDVNAAAASIRTRELQFRAGGDPPSGKLNDLDYCIRLVQTYVAAAERFAGSKNYFRVEFENIQANPRKTLEELARFCGLRVRPKSLETAAATIRAPI
jgi:hypothetical protein